MKNIPYVLAIQSMVGVLLCARAFGQSYTTATVSGYAFAGNYAQSNPDHASGSTTGDFSSGFSVWDSSAQANSIFGFNRAYTEAGYAFAVGYGDPGFGDSPSGSASYSLTWSTADNSQSGSLISVEAGLGDTINGEYSGVLSFVYGTPYNIQSLLGVNASYPYVNATASSLWVDAITFFGQPDGTAGSATFTVSLSGSMTEQESQFSSGSLNFNKTTVVGDFNGDAVLSSIGLPDGASIGDASGFDYLVPEPGTFSLLGLGLSGLWLHRFEPNLRAACRKVSGQWKRYAGHHRQSSVSGT